MRIDCYDHIVNTVQQTKAKMHGNAEKEMAQAYWKIGKYLVESKLNEKKLSDLSSALVKALGTTFKLENLMEMIKLYQNYNSFDDYPAVYTEDQLIAFFHVYANVKYEETLSQRNVWEAQAKYLIDHKALPIGVDNFSKMIQEDYYFVDKTSFIEKLLLDKAEVTLITRPRRFGKTLAMNMLYEFLRIDKDNELLFHNTYIAKTKLYKKRNHYPVIYLTFKDCKGGKSSMLSVLFEQLFDLLSLHLDIWQSSNDEGLVKRMEIMYRILEDFFPIKEESVNYLSGIVKRLTQALYLHYQQPVIVIIDEYDTPFIEAYSHGYFSEVKGFLSNLYSQTLKGNPYLKFAVMTGIQRVAKEDVFSGLNNLKVCTIDDKDFADSFGFTQQETKDLLAYYGIELSEEVKQMYDGYNIGSQDIYNPWSILNYAHTKELKPYWMNTGSCALIKKTLAEEDGVFKEAYDALIKEGKTTVEVDMYASFDEINIWTLFINAGYLKIVKNFGNDICLITFVNNEIRREFMKMIGIYLHVSVFYLHQVIQALIELDMKGFLTSYQKLLIDLPSYHDLKDENSYHMLMLGLCAMLSERYEIFSNREQGKGRSDLYLKVLKEEDKNIVIEFKYTRDAHVSLNDLAEQACTQIEEIYIHEQVDFILGIAHCGKSCEIAFRS